MSKLYDYGRTTDKDGKDYGHALGFHCPGCGYDHAFRTGGNTGPQWGFNGNMDLPTFTPSLLCNKDEPASRCHSFVRDGKIQFLQDCWHALKGQTVEIPDWDADTGAIRFDATKRNIHASDPAPTSRPPAKPGENMIHDRYYSRYVYHPKVRRGVLVTCPADSRKLEVMYGGDGWVDSPDDLPAEGPAGRRPPSLEEVMAAGYERSAAARIVAGEWIKVAFGMVPYGDVPDVPENHESVREWLTSTWGIARAVSDPVADAPTPDPVPPVSEAPAPVLAVEADPAPSVPEVAAPTDAAPIPPRPRGRR